MSTAKFDTLSNLAGTQTVPVATVAQGSAKAWVNFNGTGTVAIRASFNVSSITDNGTGDYTVNFTTAMPDANYCLNVNRVIFNVNYPRTIGPTSETTLNTTSCRFITGYTLSSGTATAEDAPGVYVSIFR